ncbi:hypothetical protein AX14_000701 [Amanita brunnescens Koide BX004]|nr:hypothetical protein AX14_000701 [Amanita brunnescens Koide BX004]
MYLAFIIQQPVDLLARGYKSTTVQPVAQQPDIEHHHAERYKARTARRLDVAVKHFCSLDKPFDTFRLRHFLCRNLALCCAVSQRSCITDEDFAFSPCR